MVGGCEPLLVFWSCLQLPRAVLWSGEDLPGLEEGDGPSGEGPLPSLPVSAVLGMGPNTLPGIGKCCVTESHPGPLVGVDFDPCC